MNTSPQLQANGNISPSTFCKIDTSGDDLALQAGANDVVIGIAQEGARDPQGVSGASAFAAIQGDSFKMYGLGEICLLKAGSGGWTRGDKLESDASGNGITAATSGGVRNIGAIALESVAANGFARVQVVLQQMQPAALSLSGALTVTSTSTDALDVGANGSTNPVLKINANTASVATGVSITGAAAAAGVAIAAISSGTPENMTIDAKGTGTLTLQSVATGNVVIGPTGKLVMAGTLTAGGLLGNAIQIGTSGPLIYSGSGAPTISAAIKGSLYLRSDGTNTANRAYIATDTAGTWTNLTTAA